MASFSGKSPADARVSYCMLNGAGCPATYHDALECRDLSRGGVLFTTDRLLAPAAAVQVCFALPERPYHVLALGRVVTCEALETESSQLVKVEFLGFPSRALGDYLNQFDLPEDVDLAPGEDEAREQTAPGETPQPETGTPG